MIVSILDGDSMMKTFLIAGIASLCAFSHPAHAATATLETLLGSVTLTQGDVTFSNFAFADNVPTPALDGDFIPDPNLVDVTTSATASTTTLTFSFLPPVAISGVDPAGSEHIFDFFIDFDVSVSAASSRTLTGLTLGDGDLSASGTNAFAQVAFNDASPIPVNALVGIFEATEFGSQVTDISTLPDLSSLSLFGRIEGETNASDSTAGLSTFALTFDLDGTPPVTPPATPVPLPASLPLILSGLGGLALLRRRKNI
jgi:hypothetical protein